MQIIDERQFCAVALPEYQIMDEFDGKEMIKKLERIIRVCYKSEDKICDGSAERLIKQIIKSGHTAMLEHENITVKFITDRGVTHELVRHRHCGFAQESSRYCSYNNAKFGNKITVIKPLLFDIGSTEYQLWIEAMDRAGQAYFDLKNLCNVKNDMARGVLPTDLKTEITVTASLREWRAIFGLRCANDAHPAIRSLMRDLLVDFHNRIPVVFDDLYEKFFREETDQNGS